MINERLFKKFNSLFWAILSWLPVFLMLYFLLCYTISLDITSLGDNYSFGIFCADTLTGFSNVLEEFLLGDFFLVPILSYVINISGFPESTTVMFLVITIGWFLFVQVLHLLVYFFMWFINLIKSLFDFMTFHKKGSDI